MSEQLKKLNRDCNNTAGLEEKLIFAIGVRIMLRRNIDAKSDLVKGATSTIISLPSSIVRVKFDHLSDPFDVEMVETRFMVMKNYYVYRKQFPIILAYVVTIHKYQDWSLDCALIDLSVNVFAAGIDYVALSRLRSLKGLHLLSFDPTQSW